MDHYWDILVVQNLKVDILPHLPNFKKKNFSKSIVDPWKRCVQQGEVRLSIKKAEVQDTVMNIYKTTLPNRIRGKEIVDSQR